MGERGRRKGPRGRAQNRVRDRVRESARGGGTAKDGRRSAGRKSAGRRRGPSFDVGDLEGYAKRLGEVAGKGGPEFSGAASGLAGAASGLAGGGLAQRLLGESAGVSDEDFKKEVLGQLELMDERLRQIEERMPMPLEGGAPAEPAEPGYGPDPSADPDVDP